MAEPIPQGFKFPTIMCFVCKKTVERIVLDEDDYSFAMTISVFCHGAKDEMRLNKESAHEIGADTTGIAFQPTGTGLPAPQRSIAHG